MITNPDLYECKYCSRTFKREKAFMEHRCKLMDRYLEIETPIGQAAWQFYEKWLKAQRKMAPKIKTFLSSKYYKSFIKFAEFVRQVGLADTNRFIKMMVEKNILPLFWTADEAYVSYLEYIDRKVTPLQQVAISIKTLIKHADDLEIPVEDVITELPTSDLMQLIRERKLTPWLLLKSTKFNHRMRKAQPHHRELISNLIRYEFWSYKLKKEEKIVKKIEQIVQEYNL